MISNQTIEIISFSIIITLTVGMLVYLVIFVMRDGSR